MSNEVLGLGELLLRMSPESYFRVGQTDRYHSYYGGGEANVMVSLSHLGHKTGLISKISKNALGEGGISYLKGHSVDTSLIVRDDGMQGIYFIESGFGGRPGEAIYNRKGSSATTMQASDFDFDAIMEGAKWFHISGIVLALGENVRQTVYSALRSAKRHNVKVSFDFNYRAHFLSLDEARKIYPKVLPYVNVLFAASFDFINILGYSPELSHSELFHKAIDEYGFDYIFGKHRHIFSANEQSLKAYVYDKAGYKETHEQSFSIFDRIGAGDAFAAGVIHKLLLDFSDSKGAIGFGLANCILKQTLAGDVSTFNEASINEFIQTSGKMEVKR
ncbi:MAG: sugar kinase [Bacillota bacterium]|nr:sugar kinase [Bacillota bacterium]